MTDGTVGADRWPRSFLARLRLSDFGASWLARRYARVATDHERFPKPEPSVGGDSESAALLVRVEAHDADNAWALYRVLGARTQEYIANHVSTRRWGDLLVREVRDIAIGYMAPIQPPSAPIAPVDCAGSLEAASAAPFEASLQAHRLPSAEEIPPEGQGYGRVLAFKRTTVTCRACGWRGFGGACPVTAMQGNEILEYSCPTCTGHIARVNTPTLEEYHEAWVNLNEGERSYVFYLEYLRDAAELRPTP